MDAKKIHESTENYYTFIAPEHTEPIRADLFITQQFPKYSRTFFQKLIEKKLITLNNKPLKSSTLIKPGDSIAVEFPSPNKVAPILSAETIKEINNLNVSIIYQHPEFLIVNKPAGLIVHKPTATSSTITLVDWLLFHFKDLGAIGLAERPGIVHRLDKDTSGLMIIALTNHAHTVFSNLFKSRQIEKKYLAIVQGHPPKEGTIDFSIGRDSLTPHKMSHKARSSRNALTHYKVLEYFADTALLEVSPITGRTHQIRVHCAAMGHPLLGDSLYGKASKYSKRQALHATKLNFTFENQQYSFSQEPPSDFKEMTERLRKQT